MIRVLPYSPQYAPGVVSVILPIQQQEFGIPVTLQAQPDLSDIPGFYQAGCGNFWVALDEGQVVGTRTSCEVPPGHCRCPASRPRHFAHAAPAR